LDHGNEVELKNCVQNISTFQIDHSEVNGTEKPNLIDDETGQKLPIDRFVIVTKQFCNKSELFIDSNHFQLLT
jgi:hypothetical protein